MDEAPHLQFDLPPLQPEPLRPAGGLTIQMATGVIQMVAAVRAYNSYGECKDWMDKLSNAYVVALSTRSADTLAMKTISEYLGKSLSTSCAGCKEASVGSNVVRETLFPALKSLREHANDLIHHLDDPKNQGIGDLNIKGIYSYCYQLFHDHIDVLYGRIPNPTGRFPERKCKRCRSNGA